MRLIATIHLLTSTGLVLAGGPGGPSNVKTAPAGPDKLDLCGCTPITNKMAECQSVKGVNENIRDCVCIPNREPGNWYGHIHNCGACLNYDNDDDAAQLFFDNLASTISQLYVSCTNVGGGVVSDGHSICASNAMFEACAALNKGRNSWSSFERDGEISNGTYFLNIDVGAEPEDDDETGSTTGAPGPSVTSSATGASSASPTGTGAEITSPAQTGTGTAATSTSTSTTTSSAILTMHSDSRMAGIIALLAVFSAAAF